MAKQELKKNIGLLGGSFNPAHEGHIYISQKAVELLGIDEVWWLVSPQNPRKPRQGMQPFETRFEYAKNITKDITQITVSDFEQTYKTQYTYDSLSALKKEYEHNFIWLMGADNLATFHKWHKWQEIFKLVPIAIFDRGNYAIEALASNAAHEFSTARIPEKNATEILHSNAPAWCFLTIDRHPASSSSIRNE